MKRLKEVVIFAFLFNSFLATYVNGVENSLFNKSEGRHTKSYVNETLSAEEYHEAGLKGELISSDNKGKKALFFSSLKLISEKPDGVNQGGVYRDVNGEFWILKEAQNPIFEYLGSKLMDLLVGPLSPEVKLLPDATGYTASKLLPGFLMKKDVMDDPDHKLIVGEEKLEIAMDLIGLEDRHDGNQGYIDMGDRLEAARVDFDHSFEFAYIDEMPRRFVDSKASKSIIDIPNEMIFRVLGIAYNDLWESGISLDYDKYKDLASKLIARKNALKDLFPKMLEFELIYNKIKTNCLIYSSEDYKQLCGYIEDLYNREPLLHWAISTGEMSIVQFFLYNGADINAKNKFGETPLHEVAINKNLEFFSLLLSNGANVNAKNIDDYTPLHYAVMNGNLEIVRVLLKNGADVNAKNINDYMPLHYAVMYNNLEIVRVFLENGANANEKTSHGDTPLHYAVMNDNLEMIRLLLEKDIDVNAKDNFDKTALHLALENDNLEIIELLLNNNADVNAKNWNGKTPLYSAFQKKNLEVVSLLLANGADVNVRFGYLNDTLLHEAIENKFFEVVPVLLSHNIDINAENKWGYIPLHNAVKEGFLELVTLLLNAGADVNAKNTFKDTPLVLAIEGQYSEIVSILLTNGADVNIKDSLDNTSLHMAVKSGNLEIVSLLLENGAEGNAMNFFGESALHLASENGNEEIVRLLLKNENIDVNLKKYSWKQSPLEIAKEKGYSDIVSLLEERSLMHTN